MNLTTTTSTISSSARHNDSRRPRGVALVIVLAFITLLIIVSLAFFASVNDEAVASRSYADGASVKQLADASVQMVIGMLRQATNPGAGATWASQPGLIRTYDADGDQGNVYKLYSSDRMMETPGAAAYDPGAELDDAWDGKPAMFTDLNVPVRDGQGRVIFPIIDPRAAAIAGGKTTPLVEGFSYTTAINRVVSPASGEDGSARLPMPVKWIYVLKDGTMTAPTGVDASGKRAMWTGLLADKTPSASNPIVSRVAFWTDDETCKLNINVASEGTFWDRPYANVVNDASPYAERSFSKRMPLADEYQRFPGHPAMTCLSPVLGMLTDFETPAGNYNASAYPIFRRYYDLVPRIGWKGSQAGTLDITAANMTSQKMEMDQDRLYGSVDELLYAAPTGTPAATRQRQGLTRDSLEKARFFLTAYNRAPELNLFGRPRITLWPLQQENDPNAGKPNGTSGGGTATCPDTARNAKDHLIALCSSMGVDASGNKRPYFFQRHTIFLRDLVNNRLRSGRAVGANGKPLAFMQLPPGFVPPSSQRPSLDWTGVPRNRELYAYLQELTAAPIPGFGSNFLDKYNAVSGGATQRDQILIQMVDLVRSGANVFSTSLPPRYDYAPGFDLPDATVGHNQIVPLIPAGTSGSDPGAGTKGFGRFPLITEAALHFHRVEYTPPGGGTPEPRMRCMLLFETASPTGGPMSWALQARFVVRGLENIRVNGEKNLFLNQPFLTNLLTGRDGYGSGGNHTTAFSGLHMPFRRWKGSHTDENKHILTINQVESNFAYDEELHYPFISKGIQLPDEAANFTLSTDDEITVEMHAGYATAAGPETLVQTYHFKFPNWTLLPPLTTGLEEQASETSTGINSRLDSGGVAGMIRPDYDTMRSLELDPNGPSGGDLRMLGVRKDVPRAFFFAHPSGSVAARRVVHSLRLGDSAQWGGLLTGTNLVSGGTTPVTVVAARGLQAATMNGTLAGDWDNGIGERSDGAYINKPDEAAVGSSAEGAYFSTGGMNLESGVSFSPNRQVSSGVMFGSLPAGGFSNQPWRTLLFCANPAAGRQHPGFELPRDHLLLDFFTMPVVEPYAISEPFSTAGKVNLNFQIAPFTYITRTTALRGVMKSTKVLAMAAYKPGGGTVLRRNIDMDETLRGFTARFNRAPGDGPFQGDAGLFRSASELCEMHLVPEGATLAQMENGSWWNTHRYTGDNSREFPYGHIYPRVTTKSNTYTVHYRVQTLKKARSTDQDVWVEDSDLVASESRGSALIERYIDPADPALPDFATSPGTTAEGFYRYRIVNTKIFAP